MISPNLRRLGGFALAVALVPSGARAQTARSFEELQRSLKPGQTVLVTDHTGLKVKGKVAEVSPSSLIILTKETTRDAAGREHQAWTGRRIFVEPTMTEIRRPDSLVNGALIGAGVGAGLALWDYLIDPSEPGNAAITATLVGLGTAIGAGIDALVNKGGKVLYLSPHQTPDLTLSPLLGKDRQGVLVSVRF